MSNLDRLLRLVIFAGILIIIGAVVYILVGSHNHTRKFNAWARQCRNTNGHIEIVEHNKVECFINGKMVTLPGWERY